VLTLLTRNRDGNGNGYGYGYGYGKVLASMWSSSRLTTCIDAGIETCVTEAAAFSMNAPTTSLTRKDRHA
jgi:hypothetical protein